MASLWLELKLNLGHSTLYLLVPHMSPYLAPHRAGTSLEEGHCLID